MSSLENKATVSRLFEAANEGVAAWHDAHKRFSPDLVAHFGGQPPLDFAAHEQFGRMLFDAFPDIRYTVEDLVAEGDRVAVRWSASGTHRGAFQGIPATGRRATVAGLSINRFVDGRVVEQWSIFDQLGMLQQLGVIPAPEQAG